MCEAPCDAKVLLAMFTEEQISHLSRLRFINNIDHALKIISAVQLRYGRGDTLDRVLLVLELYFNGDLIDKLSFNLHNYTYEEIVDIARNVRNNEFVMQEVDICLAGDIE